MSIISKPRRFFFFFLDIAHLILGEFRLSPSTNDSKVVRLAQHFYYPDTRVEV